MAPRLFPVVVLSLLAAGLLCLTGCGRHKASPPAVSPTVAATATGTASALATPAGATAAATENGTPVPGATFKVGDVSVQVQRFRAQVTTPDGVNIRSAPVVAADNRVGSVPNGSIVEVEGVVAAGQEAVPGQGTTWYFLGMSGSTPQFVYGAAGTLQPVSGSATAAPTPTLTPTSTPVSTPAPVQTPGT